MDVSKKWGFKGWWQGGTVLAIDWLQRDATQHTLLAATSSGLFCSVDGGGRWQQVGQGLLEPALVTVACAPATAGAHAPAYASGEQGRLYRSDDAGQSWRELTSWAGLGVITALAFSPTYAVDSHIFAATPAGVFRTQDGGQSWESSTFGLLDSEILCITCAPDYESSQTAWVGTANGGLFRSRNGGRSWRESGAGLPDAAVQCLLVLSDYGESQRLFVGMEEQGIYHSTDGGASWQPVGSELAGQSINCLTAVNHGKTLLAGASGGIYFSDDGGQRWQAAHKGEMLALHFTETDDGPLFAALYGEGVARSVDGGRSWEVAAAGLSAHAPPVVAQLTPDLLYALDRSGELARSEDGGRTWAAEEFDSCQSIAHHVGGGQATVVVAVDGMLYLRRELADAQKDWHPVQTPAQEIQQIVLSPTFDQDASVLVHGAGNELFLTQNGGASWQIVPPPRARDALLQVGLTSPPARTSPPAPLLPGEGGFELSSSLREGVAIVAVTATANQQGNYQFYVWQSRDQGQSWESLAGFESETPAVQLLALNDAPAHTILLATQNRLIKLYRDDAGALAVDQHFFDPNLRITALAASPIYGAASALYVGTNRGLFTSPDDGATWQPLGHGLPEQPVVAVLPTINEIRVVLLGGTVWVV